MAAIMLRAHLIQAGQFFLGIAVAIFAIGLVRSWDWVVALLSLLCGGPAVLIAMFLGAAVFTIHGIRLAAESDETLLKRAVVILAAPAMLGVTLTAAMPTLSAGMLTGAAVRLFWNQDRYEAIIEAERQRAGARSPGRRPADGIRYSVDAGPPLRVAFNSEGIGDNWSGIVFDPTHEVMLANERDDRGRSTAPSRVTELFGGDVVGCRRLWGDYFHCGFT
jgi:hypothetical protein